MNFLAAQNQALQEQQTKFLEELKEGKHRRVQADKSRQESQQHSFLAEQHLKEREENQKIIYQLNQETLALVREIQSRDEKHE